MIYGEWELEDFLAKINDAMQSGGWQPTGALKYFASPTRHAHSIKP